MSNNCIGKWVKKEERKYEIYPPSGIKNSWKYEKDLIIIFK